MNLTAALARFNRKERYWLIRNALGPSSEWLDAGFRARLAKAIGADLPADAWWAMDYHLDWLVGALTLVSCGERGFEPQRNDAGLVKGSQEDMDLVVAFDDTLVLVEAKGDTAWSNAQFGSKIDRLERLRMAGLLPQSIKIFLVLMSPGRPDGLAPPQGKTWQSWMCDAEGRPLHVPLAMPDDFLKVTRWNGEAQAASADGDCWRIVPARGAVKLYE